MLCQASLHYVAPLAALLGVFAVSAILVGRWDGARCLAMLAGAPALLLATGGAITRWNLPTLPVVLAAALAALAAQVFLLLGPRRTGLWALCGALGGYVAAVGLAAAAVLVLRITGVHSTVLRDLWYAPEVGGVDFASLAVGAMVLAAVGIIADLAVAVTATVREVNQADPSLGASELFASGMRFGRDVISTEVNTLPLAILGASLGGVLLMLARPDVARWPYNWMLLANEQSTGVAAAALLGGTIALALTIPATAWLVGRVLGKRPSPAPEPSRRGWGALALLVLLAGGVGGAWVWLGGTSYRYPSRPGGTRTRLVRGTVTAADPEVSPWAPRRQEARAEVLQRLSVRTPDGAALEVLNPLTGAAANDKIARVGDRVVVREQTAGGQSLAALSDVERDRILLLYLLAACGVVVLVARWQGWRALGALGVTGALICVLLVGVVRWRLPPVWATVACMLVVAAAAYGIICGWRPKALCAAGGTVIGLGASAAAAAAFGKWMGLSGLYSKPLQTLSLYSSGRELDFRGLLVAATLIGCLGVVMDVSIGVASAVAEVRRADPRLGFGKLFAAGMAVGRKILAAMFGAILFAYIGLNVGMFVLPWVQEGSAEQLLTNERVMTEVFRVLVGGLAIVWCIPATALFSAHVGARRGRAERLAHA